MKAQLLLIALALPSRAAVFPVLSAAAHMSLNAFPPWTAEECAQLKSAWRSHARQVRPHPL